MTANITLYLAVLIAMLIVALVRQNRNQRWSRVALAQRIEWRQQWKHSASYTKADYEKLLITKAAPAKGTQPGYIHIEIGELQRWLVEANHGAQELLENALQAMVVARFREVIAT